MRRCASANLLRLELHFTCRALTRAGARAAHLLFELSQGLSCLLATGGGAAGILPLHFVGGVAHLFGSALHGRTLGRTRRRASTAGALTLLLQRVGLLPELLLFATEPFELPLHFLGIEPGLGELALAPRQLLLAARQLTDAVERSPSWRSGVSVVGRGVS